MHEEGSGLEADEMSKCTRVDLRARSPSDEVSERFERWWGGYPTTSFRSQTRRTANLGEGSEELGIPIWRGMETEKRGQGLLAAPGPRQTSTLCGSMTPERAMITPNQLELLKGYQTTTLSNTNFFTFWSCWVGLLLSLLDFPRSVTILKNRALLCG